MTALKGYAIITMLHIATHERGNKMTKKHFVELADIVKEHNLQDMDEFIEDLASFFARHNPRFSMTTWLDYLKD